MGIAGIIRFIELTHAFQKVERRVHVAGDDRLENDVEHSYQLAMVAWYMADKEDLPLNKDLVVKYALAHDLVEVYAGDTFVYTKDDEERSSKMERERAAAEKLKREFPEFSELHTLIKRYEKRKDTESKFVYALDKILPILNIYLDGGRSWKADGVTLKMLIEYKQDKVALSPRIKECFDELVTMLQKEQKTLFNEV